MTGRYPSHTGIGPAVIPPTAPYGMPKEETLLPEVLGAAGYKTAALGKVLVHRSQAVDAQSQDQTAVH